jgi:hypothetical protein
VGFAGDRQQDQGRSLGQNGQITGQVSSQEQLHGSSHSVAEPHQTHSPH